MCGPRSRQQRRYDCYLSGQERTLWRRASLLCGKICGKVNHSSSLSATKRPFSSLRAPAAWWLQMSIFSCANKMWPASFLITPFSCPTVGGRGGGGGEDGNVLVSKEGCPKIQAVQYAVACLLFSNSPGCCLNFGAHKGRPRQCQAKA